MEKNPNFFFGNKGQAIIADNYGLHRAISPQKKPRLIFWLTFSLTQSSNMNNLKLSKISPQLRFPFSKINYKLNKNNITQNLFKNLINFNL